MKNRNQKSKQIAKQSIYLLGLIFIFGILSACDKVDELTHFEMEFNETVVVPASSGINLPFNLYSPEMETNAESKFAVNDTRKDKVEQIELIQLDLEIASPASGDFGFLKSVEVFVSADGLSETRIAWKENIPDDAGNTLSLETSDKNLEEYLKKEEISMRFKTVTDELISEDHHIDVHSVFFVDAKVLGQ